MDAGDVPSGIARLEFLLQVIGATAALGVAAFGLVDATKAFWGGVSRLGFNHLVAGLADYRPALDGALRPGEWEALLKAQWINGRSLPEQKSIVRTLIRLGLTQETAAGVAAAAKVDPAALATAVGHLHAGTLTEADLAVLGRLDATVEARLDAAFARAEHQYRNASRVLAAAFAVVLAVGAVPLVVVTGATWKDYGVGVLVGLLAVPIAPVAKDLASSLSAAARAVKTVRSAAIT